MNMVFCVEVGEDNIPFVRLGEHILRLDLEDLDDKFKEVARTELRETPENVAYALDKIRQLIKEEDGLNIPVDDDTFLTKFLRPCKYYPESAFRLLKRFYKFKWDHPKVGLNLTPNHIRHVFDNEVFQFLPTRTETGARLLVINAGSKWNPKKVSLHDMFRCIMVSIEIAMLEPKTQVGGVHVILNLEGFAFMHLYQLSPQMAKMIVDWVQDCNSVRLKGIHVVNQSFVFNMAFAIFKPFLGEKLKSRIFIHGTNRNSLCEQIPKNALPKRFGGSDSVPEYPGKLLADMLFYYETDFELYNTYCYTKEPVKK